MRRLAALSVVAALLILVACAPSPARPDDPEAITMDENQFQPEIKTIARGSTLTFANTSPRALHILVPGIDAKPHTVPGVPSFGGASGVRTNVGETWTSKPWNTPGTFTITCTLHPSMNLQVVVTP